VVAVLDVAHPIKAWFVLVGCTVEIVTVCPMVFV
jgi:hypothetical protein